LGGVSSRFPRALPSGGATIASAQMASVPADLLNPGLTRDYCKVLGAVASIDPNAPPVNFEVNLPAAWNGKAVQYGGGGWCGRLGVATALWGALHGVTVRAYWARRRRRYEAVHAFAGAGFPAQREFRVVRSQRPSCGALSYLARACPVVVCYRKSC
jgi:hypothetical protein